jgi:hypothetical protein
LTIGARPAAARSPARPRQKRRSQALGSRRARVSVPIPSWLVA